MMASGLATSEPLALTLPQYQQQPQRGARFKGQFKAKEESVDMTLPRRWTKYPKTPWHIVWCHEHCHKIVMAEVARKLQDAAKTLGAGLVFLKKTKDYMTYLASRSSVPHVLVTNWREVKPSMEEMREQEHCNPPLDVMVLAEKGTIFRRATEWAMACRDVHISVLLEIGELNALLASYADKVFQESRMAIHEKTPVKSAPCMPGVVPSMKKYDAQVPTNKNPWCTDTPSAQKEEDRRIRKPSPVVQQHATGSNAPGMLAFLMEAVKNQQCAAKIQQDLLQSMPEVYED